ncbi:MAG: hypothetical protein M1834_007279 [Cirrosporium novae-zelandiae]|nr:MAG: hypothetical protein M1834_007279 [Cirrosporium novae-zelandiae]
MGLQENKQDLEDVPGVEDLKFHDVKSSVLHTEQIPERRGVEMPPLVQELSVDERNRLERKLLWKIDLRILPMIILMYILNYLDRNNIAAARLAGLEDDLRLKGTEYQTCVSILFVGYVLMQIPSNLFLNKIGKPGLYLPSAMIIWGVISGATGAVHNFGGLIACRFILGFVEAAYFPGCLFYLSSWYTRKELGLRTAILFMGSLLSGAFSGLIAAGITNGMDDKAGLASWRWLFIIEGIITVVVAFCGYFILPNFPRTTFWLSETERQLAVWRLEEDIGEDDWTSSEQQTFTYGIRLAITDIKTWILMIMLFCIASSASVINFFPSVVETLGYGSIQSLLLTAPPYLLCVITAGLTAWSADRTGERYFHVTIPIYVAIIANVIAATTTAVAPRYLSMMLMIPGVYSSYSVVLAWISNSMPRPVEKRAAALAAINAVGNCANIFGSFMYPSSQAPRYVVAMSINCATAAVAIVAATVLRVVLVRLNKKLDHGKTVEGMTDVGAVSGQGSSKGFRFLI